jgi:hypothetical protein
LQEKLDSAENELEEARYDLEQEQQNNVKLTNSLNEFSKGDTEAKKNISVDQESMAEIYPTELVNELLLKNRQEKAIGTLMGKLNKSKGKAVWAKLTKKKPMFWKGKTIAFEHMINKVDEEKYMKQFRRDNP